MRHLILLLDFLCLVAGLLCLARFASAHRAERSQRSRSRLLFFAAYSYVMVTAALFAYAAVNMGLGAGGQVSFASLVFLGMAALELSLPRMSFADRGASLSRPARALLWAGAGLTAAQSIVIWAPLDRIGRLASFAGAFAPFCAVVAWAIVAGARLAASKGRPSRRERIAAWSYGLVYCLIFVGSALEIRRDLSGSEFGAFLPLALPLAYLTSSLQFYAATARRKGGPESAAPRDLVLPGELALRHHLSPRETEIGGFILKGLGNKEIAAALGISENTVRNHIYSLYQKLGIQKRMDLVGLVRSGVDSTKIPGSEEGD